MGDTVDLNQVAQILVTYRHGVNKRPPVMGNRGFNNQITRLG